MNSFDGHDPAILKMKPAITSRCLLLVLVVSVLLSTDIAVAAPLAVEDFTGYAGALSGKNGGIGFPSAWGSAGGNTPTNTIVISPGGSDGASAVPCASTFRALPASVKALFAAGTGEVWMSFELISSAEPQQFGGLSFFAGTTEVLFIGHESITAGTSPDTWALFAKNGTTIEFAVSPVLLKTMKTGVVKIDLAANRASFWVGAAVGPVDVSGRPAGTVSGMPTAGIDSIRIAGNAGFILDNIRISAEPTDTGAVIARISAYEGFDYADGAELPTSTATGSGWSAVQGQDGWRNFYTDTPMGSRYGINTKPLVVIAPADYGFSTTGGALENTYAVANTFTYRRTVETLDLGGIHTQYFSLLKANTWTNGSSIGLMTTDKQNLFTMNDRASTSTMITSDFGFSQWMSDTNNPWQNNEGSSLAIFRLTTDGSGGGNVEFFKVRSATESVPLREPASWVSIMTLSNLAGKYLGGVTLSIQPPVGAAERFDEIRLGGTWSSVAGWSRSRSLPPPACIASGSIQGNMLKMIVQAPDYYWVKYQVQTRSNLLLGEWVEVSHTSGPTNALAITNLTYSSTEGRSAAVYMDAAAPIGFYRIVGEE